MTIEKLMRASRAAGYALVPPCEHDSEAERHPQRDVTVRSVVGPRLLASRDRAEPRSVPSTAAYLASYFAWRPAV